MTILVADSGSTKTEWIYQSSDGEKDTFYSEGLNPYFKDSTTILEIVKDAVATKIPSAVDKIYFYGAGCSSQIKQLEVTKAITDCFPNASVRVDTDLMGAAIACFGDEPGVACILGTGSNACLYDGETITSSIPSLGFTLGDEGSGGYFGKLLLRAYFYKTMPEDLRRDLENQRLMRLDDILDHVYRKPAPNRFVASFARMLADHSNHPFIKKIVTDGFAEFVDQQLGYFGDVIRDKNLGFVGSIAKIHQDSLTKVLSDRGLQPPKVIIQKPIEGILEYHTRLD